MYHYFIWPGAYDFTQEIGLLLKYIKEQVDLLVLKIENAQNNIY